MYTIVITGYHGYRPIQAIKTLRSVANPTLSLVSLKETIDRARNGVETRIETDADRNHEGWETDLLRGGWEFHIEETPMPSETPKAIFDAAEIDALKKSFFDALERARLRPASPQGSQVHATTALAIATALNAARPNA